MKHSVTEGHILLDKKLNIIDINFESWKDLGFRPILNPIGNSFFESFPQIKTTINVDQISSVIEKEIPLCLRTIELKDLSDDKLFDVVMYKRFDGIGIIVRDIHRCNLHHKEIALLKDQINKYKKKVLSTRDDERRVIAHEIHDVLGQDLTGLKFQLINARKQSKVNEEECNKALDFCTHEVDRMVQSVKKITSGLIPDFDTHQPISETIKQYIAQHLKNTDIKVNLHISPDRIILDPDILISVFRIFQESLTNILRHSKADAVNISLTHCEDRIHLSIKDNGVGIENTEIDSFNSFGLIGMRERCEQLRGKFEITSIQNKGTTVEVIIPL